MRTSKRALQLIGLASTVAFSGARLVDVTESQLCIFSDNQQEDPGVCGEKYVAGICEPGATESDNSTCGALILLEFPNGNMVMEFEPGFEVCPDQMFLPLIPGEQLWDPTFRLILYTVALIYCFFGIAIVADIFMSAIEVITSQEKVIIIADDKGKKRQVTIKVWNETVANLTLMALGSSAPEILLAVIETVAGLGKMPEPGGLGPSTIVGSAAFNLLAINAICVSAIPANEDGTRGVRRVKEFGVFGITAFFSVFAYVWLFIVVQDDEVEIWEALLTLLYFPLMVFLSWKEDNGKLFARGKDYSVSPGGDRPQHIVGTGGMGASGYGKDDVAALLKRRRSYVEGRTPEELAREAQEEMQAHQHTSRMRYRIDATRFLAGGRRVVKKKKDKKEIGTLVGGDDGAGGSTPDEAKADGKVAPSPSSEPEVEFASANYSIFEDASPVVLQVIRRGDLMRECKVHFETRNGSATAGHDYDYTSGVLEFAVGQGVAEVSVKIVDDNEYEPDETFFVSLYRPDGCRVGDIREAEVLIINDDCPGTFQFARPGFRVKESEAFVEVVVSRSNGCDGEIVVTYTTMDGSAVAGKDYEKAEGKLVFAHNEMTKSFKVSIMDDNNYEKDINFQVEMNVEGLGENGAILGDVKTALVNISNDDKFAKMVDQVAVLLNMDADKLRISTETWMDQIKGAMEVAGEDDDEDPAVIDYVMHVVTFGWKVVFSLVPPTSYKNGWVAFFSSLMMVGVLTGFVADIASLFGCMMGISDAITAITFVALGTSLPDTFASKTAAVNDEHADASVGNVTGSNSVNVFLGLGLPWTIASVYYAATGEQDGKYIVFAGSLGWSVAVFCPCAVVCLSTLVLRRSVAGGELGGGFTQITSAFFLSLWFLYIILSALESEGVITNPM